MPVIRDISVLRPKKYRRLSLLVVILALIAIAALAAILIYQIPSMQDRINWKWDEATTYIRGVVNPVEPIPTAMAYNPDATVPAPAVLDTLLHTATPTATTTPLPPTAGTTAVLTATPVVSPTPTLTPTAIPGKALLPPPAYEKQGMNNCGPATLTQYLRFYGWQGNQNDIAAVIKPNPDDKNVNVEELVYFARNHAGWLNTEYRVGGNIDLIRKFIAAGIPVMIEEGSANATPSWPNDDQWAGHYLFIHGYDDALKIFTTEDTWLGPNRQVLYSDLDKNWQAFNRVYILIYSPDKEDTVKSILGDDWDVDTNRKNALAQSQADIQKDSNNGLAWFNQGSNQVYFQNYVAAAVSFDKARQLGLPQRMLRYQFTPFIAYFNAGRTDELMTLTDYALSRTPNSEEALLWRGWGLLRQGNKTDAIDSFNKALAAHPGYADALYALDFAQKN
jgi:tetratricopeptide (TPR) repeat protein